ncbi:hypothetical protein EVAR_102494_1 [Eumeta japonica]|uniref:Uncharacterized protein n=1 Tax=Eumeta variegata TaxID=151549 RepID=A0A4C1ZHE0_EUMVA|nr:hypothetical protein EVAR_102494_1 [Eumeta japonica]
MVDMMTEIFIIHVEDDVSDEIMMKAQAAGVSDDDEMTTLTPTRPRLPSSPFYVFLSTPCSLICETKHEGRTPLTTCTWIRYYYICTTGFEDGLDSQINMIDGAAGMSNGWTDWDEIFYVYSNGSLDDSKHNWTRYVALLSAYRLKLFRAGRRLPEQLVAARDISTCLFPPYHMQKQMTQSHVLGGLHPRGILPSGHDSHRLKYFSTFALNPKITPDQV